MIPYEIGVLIAVFAFVYTNLLTDEKQIFNGLYNWLESRLIDKKTGKTHWLFYVTIGCEKCVAGQLALWIFLYNNPINYITNPLKTSFLHFAFITFTILTTEIIKNIHKQTQK